MGIKDQLIKFTGTASALGLNILQAKGAEPQMSYKWKVFMPKLSGTKDPLVQGVNSFPFPSFNVTSMHVGGALQYFPTTEEMAPLSLIIFQDSKGDALNYFTNWKSRIKNPDGTYNYPKDYKFNIELKLQDKLDTEVFNLKCIGCWPVTIAPLNLAYDTTDTVKLGVDFSVDRLYLKQSKSGLTGLLSSITGQNITSFF